MCPWRTSPQTLTVPTDLGMVTVGGIPSCDGIASSVPNPHTAMDVAGHTDQKTATNIRDTANTDARLSGHYTNRPVNVSTETSDDEYTDMFALG